MRDRVDALLDRAACTPLGGMLDDLDDRIIARIAAAQSARTRTALVGGTLATGLVAAAIGIAAAPPETARAATPLAAFGAPMALAPSNLLGGGAP